MTQQPQNTTPATLHIEESAFQKPTQAEWKKFLQDTGVSADEVLKTLGVKRLSDFDGDLEDATKLLNQSYEEEIAPDLNNVTALSVSDRERIAKEIRRRYTVNLQGKWYLVVTGRVLLFRLYHPLWSVTTRIYSSSDSDAIFEATVATDTGLIIATGYGRSTAEGSKNAKGRFIERAETAAIGRALALAGYGTDSSLDDSDHLADSPR